MSDSTPSVLRRLVAPPPAKLAMTVPRAAERALLRTFQDQLGLPVRVDDVVEGDDSVQSWSADIPEKALKLVLEGPGGRTGAAVLDPGLCAAVVEMRLTGHLADEQPPVRDVTAIDTALLEQFVNAAMTQFATRLDGMPQAGWAKGFKVARPIEDARLYQFALPEGPMPALGIKMTLGSGPRQGELRLLLPPLVAGQPVTGAAGQAGVDWTQSLTEGFLGTNLPIDAVMDRQAIPLAQVAGWKAGDMVPVSGAALNSVRLEAAGGTVLALGRLGQSSGQRAIKLHVAVQAGGLVTPRPQLQNASPDEDTNTAFVPDSSKA